MFSEFNHTWSIITPVCNQAQYTTSLLSWHFSAYVAQRAAPVELVIIDNGSNDQTPAVLGMYGNMYGDRLRIVSNEENLGFGEACNQGADVATAEALLFLNNDVHFQGEYLSSLDRALAQSPDGLLGPQLLDSDTGWNRFGEKIINYIGGWCLAMAADTFEVLGRFDSRYAPADFEDIDLCYTAQLQGRPLIQVPLPIFHIADQTAPHVLPNRRAITIRNQKRFAQKWALPIPQKE